jgi:hypothetical protein
MKFLRRTAGHILLGHRSNEDILEPKQTQPKRNQHTINKNGQIILAGLKVKS